MAKSNPTEKQIEGWASVKTHRRVQKLSLQIAKIDLNYKLQLIASEYQKKSPRGVPWYTNADLKISLYLRVHIKIIP